MSKRALAAGLIAGAAVVAVAGCANRTLPGHTVYKTVTVTPDVAASPSTSAVAAVRSRSHDVSMARLPGTCDDLLSVGTLVNTLGHDLGGRTAFVVGLPDAATGRVSYLNCRYSIRPGAPSGRIEIGVSLYRTAAKAAARIKPTVSDYVAHGASSTTASVAGRPAELLIGGTGTDYAPTVVLADGQRTIVVTVRDPGDATSELLRLALLTDRRTA
jgi:prolyl-tRNA editing enzyme YbaK/EbsC (Cys-tRNA(Pro) deacylase)